MAPTGPAAYNPWRPWANDHRQWSVIEMQLSQAPFCPTGSLYEIQPGDTLSAIAARFGTTVDAIIAANPGIEPLNLQIGQVICVPGPRGACPNGILYSIQPGDTFFALAQRFNVTLQALLAANPQADPNQLQIGQIVCIPTLPPAPGALCCVTLPLGAEIPPSQLFPGGVALIKPAAPATDAVSVTFAATSLPPPSELGDFDAYLGQVVFPAVAPGIQPNVYAVILQSIQTDNQITWAGTRIIPEQVPSNAVLEIRAIRTTIGRGGITILRSIGRVCQ